MSVNLQEVRDVVRKVAHHAALGKHAAFGILAGVGAKNLPSVSPEKYHIVYDACVRELRKADERSRNLKVACGLGTAHHGWRVERSMLKDADRRVVELEGARAAVVGLRYAV